MRQSYPRRSFASLRASSESSERPAWRRPLVRVGKIWRLASGRRFVDVLGPRPANGRLIDLHDHAELLLVPQQPDARGAILDFVWRRQSMVLEQSTSVLLGCDLLCECRHRQAALHRTRQQNKTQTSQLGRVCVTGLLRGRFAPDFGSSETPRGEPRVRCGGRARRGGHATNGARPPAGSAPAGWPAPRLGGPGWGLAGWGLLPATDADL